MATTNYNQFTTKRAARRDASYDLGNELISFAKVARRSSQFPLPVRDGDSISVLEPNVVNFVTGPRIERTKVAVPRENTSVDSDNFNYSNSVLQNVEELYWDLLGELSNFAARELSVSANFSVNICTESREEMLLIDMHILEFGSSSKFFKIVLRDTEGLSEHLKQTPIERSPTRLYFLQDVSVHTSPIVSRLLSCSMDVFRDHIKRASDDVAFLIPSRSCIQDHVVIPYQRCYRRGSAKSIRELQNKRSTFCHSNLVSSEKHVTEAYMLLGLKPWYLATTEVRLSEKESFEEYLKQLQSMLKMNLRIIDSLKSSHWFRHEHEERLKDYQSLENKVMIQMKQNSASIPLLTAMIAVGESRKVIRQANEVKALTILATVYIPLSFFAGDFGMNVAELNSGIDVDIWLYFAISIPVTTASMVDKKGQKLSNQIKQEFQSEKNRARSSFLHG